VLHDLGPACYVDDTDGKTVFFARPPLPPRTKWTRRVPHLVLIGHAASLSKVFFGVRQGAEASQLEARLGALPPDAGRWLACARQKLWWMSPDVGARDDPVPPETQFLLAQLADGMYVVVLPLVGNSFRTALWGADGSLPAPPRPIHPCCDAPPPGWIANAGCSQTAGRARRALTARGATAECWTCGWRAEILRCAQSWSRRRCSSQPGRTPSCCSSARSRRRRTALAPSRSAPRRRSRPPSTCSGVRPAPRVPRLRAAASPRPRAPGSGPPPPPPPLPPLVLSGHAASLTPY
jgi:hypothetical protein